MGTRLTAYVHVDGVVYGPEDDLPAEIAKKITNPAAWSSDSDESEDERPKGARRTAKQ